MQQETDQEELLDLNLAVVSEYSSGTAVKKRKRNNGYSLSPLKLCGSYEGKIYELLNMREQMLKQDPMKPGLLEGGKGLHLIHLLLISATAIDENNFDSATKSIGELYQNVSLMGDSIQRVAAYFADGLVAKLLTKKSPFYNMIMKNPTQKEEFLAFTELYRASPFYQFAHFTANQAIIEAFEDEEGTNNRSLHLIDFDVSYGFQWPSLIQSLSAKATKSSPISLCITGLGSNMGELEETETRLVNFAKGCCNLVFEFRKLLRGAKPNSLRRNETETVAVNLVFHLHTLGNSLQISETLKQVYSVNPSTVILVEHEGSRRPQSFLSRFMESLHYFAAMFDSLDDCLSSESSERLSIEKNCLGKEIKSMINYGKEEDSFQRYERLETWKTWMESHGFVGDKLSSKTVIQAKLLLKLRSHCSLFEGDGGGGGFRVFERDEGFAISLGWQERCLITASAWNCVLR